MRGTAAFTAARDGATDGRLELISGGTHVTIRPAAIAALCRGEFAGIAPRANVREGRVAITYPRFTLAGLLRHPAHRTDLAPTTAVPWSILCRGGLGASSLDLRGLELRGLEIAGGTTELRVLLPRPRGLVPLVLAGGTSATTLLRPAQTAAVVRIAGGATRLRFDGERYGAIGAGTRLETWDAERPDRYDVEVLGGASRLTIAEQDGVSEQ